MTAETAQKVGKCAVVLGARGGTGKNIVFRLCERAPDEIAEIRAVVRNKGRSADEEKALLFPKSDDRVKLIFGDVLDLDSLRPAFTAAHYIFNAISGSGSRNAKVIEQTDRDAVGSTAMLLAQEFSHSLERYVLVSSQFVHPSNKWHHVRIMLNTLVTGPFASKGIMDYKWEGEVLLRKAGIPYTIVRPGHLIDGPKNSIGKEKKVLVAQTNASLGNPTTRFVVAGVCVAAAMSERAKNTTFELGTDKSQEESCIPEDLFDNLKPHFLEEESK